MTTTRTSAIILCGGHSRRMGRPKAWLPFGDEFLLQRVVRIVHEAIDDVVVVAADRQELPPLPPSVQRVNDGVPECGPLGGFAAGLAVCNTGSIFLTACDSPFLTSDFIAAILGRHDDSNCDAVVPFTDDFHPLSAVYRTSIRTVVERRLRERQLRMKNLFTEISYETWLPGTETESNGLVLRNLNTPEDYEAALTEYNSRHGTD